MSRWEYDTVFYRVFCITLLAVGFTFTVILTNVFVDIDGLLSNKVKSPKSPEPPTQELPELPRMISVNMLPEEKSEETYDDKDYPDSDDLYRSKRSLEAKERILHIKDPKVKKLLTNHLADLLDELDKESNTLGNGDRKSSTNEENGSKNENKYEQINVENLKRQKHLENHNGVFLLNKGDGLKRDDEIIGKAVEENKDETKMLHDKVNKSKKDYKSELLHLAMHNIILQGIIENTNLDEVYKKVVDLAKDFENDHTIINKEDIKDLYKSLQSLGQRYKLAIMKDSDEIMDDKNPELGAFKRYMNSNVKETPENNVVQRSLIKNIQDHNVIIKTIIEVTASNNDRSNKENDWNAKDKTNGIIKVIYNGNTLKFKRIDDENYIYSKNKLNDLFQTTTTASTINYKSNENLPKIQEMKSSKSNPSYFQKVLYDYLKGFKSESNSSEQRKLISRKRLKRHVKIRFDTNRTTSKPKTKKDDDELFVEIETHFDSKGTIGEKKKKIIRELIEKIQNAIYSDKSNSHKKKQKYWHVKKRMQNPLSSKSAAVLINKLILPFETLAHRHLDPISKAVPVHEEIPLVTNVFDHNHWQKPFHGPRFFSKFINSAEMNTFESDYNKVMKHNGIPQRLQKPLNTEMSDELFQDSRVVDLGNIKFLMKDIDGSGFSIGFNQYTDEAPDSETMKLFSGLENIIKTYHQQYDQETMANTQQQILYDNIKNTPDEVEYNKEENDKSDSHVIQKRSIQGSDESEHHTNSYRIVYGHNLLPYKIYDEIYNSQKGHASQAKNINIFKAKNSKKSSFFIDENVFEKDLKPAEILSIADLLQRKKRSFKIKKISNVKIKTNINRYLNTKKMASKNVFKNNKKRPKRQIDKIRIIARDLQQHGNSEEENIFAESDENIFTDRALVREIDMPDIDPNDKPHSIEHYDIISPQKDDEPYDIAALSQKTSEDHYDIFTPYVYEPNPFESSSKFSRRARHNSLMSKYPHIIMEEAPTYVAPNYEHGEEFLVDNTQHIQYEVETTTDSIIPTIMDVSSPSDQEINDFIVSPTDNTNYRVSVKIRPKNATGMSGFKEVHTSINKSYNKNGLMYTSLVNVSQVSKVEKVNKTAIRRDNASPSIQDLIQDNALRQQQEMIKTMIQQHKNRLDQQLKHLQMERMKLESMNIDNAENVTDILQNNDVTVKPKRERKSNQGGGKKKSIPENTTTKDTPVTRIVTTQPTTTVIKSTKYMHPKVDDHTIKDRMIETIERNENITNELLKKINQNTDILQTFLGKLIQTIEVPTRKHLEVTATKSSETTKSLANQESSTNKIGSNRQNDRNSPLDNNIPFNFDDYHYMPNMLFKNMPRLTNNSIGIPFVYAVQHPYGVAPNKDHMASVVYHGHIHTNTLSSENNIIKRDSSMQKRSMLNTVLKEKSKTEKKILDTEFWKPKPGEKVLHDYVINKNSSKFFLDETRNDFKIPLLANGNSTKL